MAETLREVQGAPTVETRGLLTVDVLTIAYLAATAVISLISMSGTGLMLAALLI